MKGSTPMSLIYIRQAQLQDLSKIMLIIAQAKTFLKNSGSSQWQAEYPNETTIQNDIAEKVGYVLMVDKKSLAIVQLSQELSQLIAILKAIGIMKLTNMLQFIAWQFPMNFAGCVSQIISFQILFLCCLLKVLLILESILQERIKLCSI